MRGKVCPWINAIHWEKVSFIEREKKNYEKSNSLRKKCFTIRISQLCFQRRKNYTVFFFRFHSSDSANHSHKIILAKSHKVPLFDKKEKSKKKKNKWRGEVNLNKKKIYTIVCPHNIFTTSRYFSVPDTVVGNFFYYLLKLKKKSK